MDFPYDNLNCFNMDLDNSYLLTTTSLLCDTILELIDRFLLKPFLRTALEARELTRNLKVLFDLLFIDPLFFHRPCFDPYRKLVNNNSTPSDLMAPANHDQDLRQLCL